MPSTSRYQLLTPAPLEFSLCRVGRNELGFYFYPSWGQTGRQVVVHMPSDTISSTLSLVCADRCITALKVFIQRLAWKILKLDDSSWCWKFFQLKLTSLMLSAHEWYRGCCWLPFLLCWYIPLWPLLKIFAAHWHVVNSLVACVSFLHAVVPGRQTGIAVQYSFAMSRDHYQSVTLVVFKNCSVMDELFIHSH